VATPGGGGVTDLPRLPSRSRTALAAIEDHIGSLDGYAHQCGAASVALVETGIYPGARVARGWCRRVLGQHSWVCLGDPYVPTTPVIDLTLWSYDAAAPRLYVGRASRRPHTPHGSALVWTAGKPASGGGEPVELTPPDDGWSRAAQAFLEALGPLDRDGWRQVANLPVLGWPAAEILAALADQGFGAYIPIDIVGMLTDRNPQGAYPRAAGVWR